DGCAPTVRAARHQISADSEPVTARLGPRLSPSSSARAWAGCREPRSTAAGRLLTATAAPAPSAAVATAPAWAIRCAGPAHDRASAPRATAIPKTPARERGSTASQTSRGAAARRHTAMAATTAPTATTPGAGEPAASISTTAAATAAPLSTAHGPTAPPAAPLAAPPTSGPTGTALGLWEVGSGPAAAVL